MTDTSTQAWERIRDLLGRAEPSKTLPQAFYTDPLIHEFDVSRVFSRSWLMVGFEGELPESGSYMALGFGPNSIVVARGRDGLIRGFHNTCRHRGSQLCAPGQGRISKFVCPYHRWTYELDGRLVGASRMPADFRPEDHGLCPIQVELLAGCIYVALQGDAPDFGSFRDAVEPLLAPYRLRDAKVAFQSTLIEKANWKLVMENARECYHCPTGHPELKRSFPVVIEPGFSFADSPHNLKFAARMTELGLSTAPVQGPWWLAGRYPLNPGMESVSMDGRFAVSRHLIDIEERCIGGFRWAVEPNSFCHALPDYAFMFAAIPIAPQETHVVCKWLVHKDAVEGVDYTVDALTDLWTRTNLQDRELAENNQRGVNGLGYVPGPYSSEAEDLVIRFADWYRAAARSASRDEGECR
jgi:glycine betaine catabolism A